LPTPLANEAKNRLHLPAADRERIMRGHARELLKL